MSQTKSIPLSEIHGMKDPIRTEQDEEAMQQLVDSVKAAGVIVPIKVRPNTEGYEIVYGHRRYHAAKAAGLTEIPAIVDDVDNSLLQGLIENMIREGNSDIEVARTMQRIINEYLIPVGASEKERRMTQVELGQMLGLSATRISMFLTLLDDMALVEAIHDHEPNSMAKDMAAKVAATRQLGKTGEAVKQRAKLLSLVPNSNLVFYAAKSIAPLGDEGRNAVLDKAEKERLKADQIERVAEKVKQAVDTNNRALLDAALTVRADVADYEQFVEARAGMFDYAAKQADRKAQRKSKEIEEFDTLVKEGISAVRNVQYWLSEVAPGGIEQGKFSPEAARFLLRRMNQMIGSFEAIRDELEEIAKG